MTLAAALLFLAAHLPILAMAGGYPCCCGPVLSVSSGRVSYGPSGYSTSNCEDRCPETPDSVIVTISGLIDDDCDYCDTLNGAYECEKNLTLGGMLKCYSPVANISRSDQCFCDVYEFHPPSGECLPTNSGCLSDWTYAVRAGIWAEPCGFGTQGCADTASFGVTGSLLLLTDCLFPGNVSVDGLTQWACGTRDVARGRCLTEPVVLTTDCSEFNNGLCSVSSPSVTVEPA